MTKATESLRKGLGIGGVGFGAFAIAAPAAFVASYGLTSTPTTNVFVRLFGTHSVALGALALTSTDASTRRGLFVANLAMNALDTVLIASATSVPLKSRAAGAVTTAAFAGASAYLVAKSAA